MPASGLLPLQAAVYAALTTDAALAAYEGAGGAAGWGVYDRVDDEATGRYIRIGEKTEVPFPVMGRGRQGAGRAWDDTITLHLWSPYAESDLETLAGLALVNAALLDRAIPLEGFGAVRLRMEIANDVPVPVEEGAWRHLTVRYRARPVGGA